MQCQASQTLQREEVEDNVLKGVCKGLLEWACSVCLFSGLAFCIIQAPLSHMAFPHTS